MPLNDAQRELFYEHLKRASEIVASWPAWKRGILKYSSKPTRDTPREVVELTEAFKYSIGSTFHTKEATLEIVNRMRRKTGEPLYFVSWDGNEAEPMSQRELDDWLAKHDIVP